MQPLEQAHAQARLQGFHLLPDSARRHMQLVRSQFETEVSSCGFEGTERIKWWEDVGHRRSICHGSAVTLQ